MKNLSLIDRLEDLVFGLRPLIIGLFIIITLVMGFGFEAVKDRWLSQQQWDDFLTGVHEVSPDQQDDDQA